MSFPEARDSDSAPVAIAITSILQMQTANPNDPLILLGEIEDGAAGFLLNERVWGGGTSSMERGKRCLLPVELGYVGVRRPREVVGEKR
jgi:hypothetical protein